MEGALMRKDLAKIDGVRATFTGTFERYGEKSGWQGRMDKTILLKDVKNQRGEVVCDHLWFNYTKAIAKLNLAPGDIVVFDARVRQYTKGYFGYRDDVYKPIEQDYKLSHPTKVRKLKEAEPVGLFESEA